MKWGAAGLLIGLLGLLALQCYRAGVEEERSRQERIAYERVTDSLAAALIEAQAKRDTLIQRVPVERVRIVEAQARVDTVRLEFAADTTVRDSLDTALDVIEVQDTVIQTQARHIRTLSEIIVSDSSVISLYRAQRQTDSTRIHRLESRQRGWTIAGFRLPKLRCGPGPGVTLAPSGSLQAGFTVACIFSP